MLPLAAGRTIYGVAGTAAAVTCTIVGDPVTAGVDGFDELDQRQLPNTATLLYTVPGTATLVGEIHLLNTTASPVSGIKFFLGGTAASNQIISLTIPANGSALYNHEGWSIRDASGVLLTTILVSLTGDVTGSGTTSIATTVTALQGHAVSVSAPSTGNALVWDGTAWSPATVVQTLTAADASVTVGGSVTARTVATGRADQIFTLHPPTGSLNFNSQEAVNAADPSSPQSLTTKAYVDNLIAALPSQPIVNYATTAALPTVTYANGSSGVGATLTATANGILIVDGVALTAPGTSVLVQNQVSVFQNGIFVLTTPGTVGTPFVLTRRSSFDTAAEMGTAVLVPIDDQGLTPGGTNDDKVFLSLTSTPFVVGTTGISFQLIGSTYSADGTSISLSGTQFSRNALTGDVTAPAGSSVTTLASVITAGGPTGSGTSVPVITWDAKGRLTAVTSASITPVGIGAVASVTNSDATIVVTGTSTNPVVSRAGIAGDVTVAAAGNVSVLATVNTNVGSFGDSSHVAAFTVNGKGLLTAASAVLITPAAIGAPAGSGTSSGANTGDLSLTAVGAVPNANAASLTGQALTLQPANGTFPGLLTAAGFTNLGNQSGTNTGDQTITLTGDVTGSGTGSFAATIGANKVTNAKLAQMAAHTFKGNNTGSASDPIDVTLAQLKTELSLSGTNTGDQTITLTGDVTGSGTGSFATTLASVITAGGPTGSGTAVPVLTWDAKGRLTAVTTAVTVGTVTATDASITVAGTATAPTISRAALTGDVTAPAGSNTTTLASVITAGGPTGSSTVVPVITWDAKGRLTAVTTATITPGGIGAVASVTNSDGTIVVTGTGTNPVISRAGITGDVAIAAAGNTSVLATVNANVGSFGDSSHVAAFTVNAKGLTTAASNVLITPAAIGAVASVTAADASVTIAGTGTNPTVATGRADQIFTLHPPTTAVNFNGQEATNAAAPSAGSSLATKTYVDSVATGVNARHYAQVVSITNQALTGLPTVDGVTLTTGQIILNTGQSTGSQNGLWAVAAGAWSRPSFFATGSDAVGSYVFVQQGTTFVGSEWFLVGAGPIIVDTTTESWVQINGAYDITVDATLTKAGNQLSRAAITGDVTIAIGSNAATLASVISAGGLTGDASHVPTITWDAKGRLTAVSSTLITPAAIGAPAGSGNSTGTNTGDQTITLGGDASGTGTGAITVVLASTITAGGPTGSGTVVPVLTWDAKGRLTAVTTASITAAGIGAIASTRQIITTLPLTGGGDLSADRTLAINGATGVSAGSLSAVDFGRIRSEFNAYADFGLKADLRSVFDYPATGPNTTQIIASGQSIVTIPNAVTAGMSSFTSTAVDGGKRITIQGAGASGAMLVSTIVSVQNSGQCTIAATAGTTVSSSNNGAGTVVAIGVQWGTDNTTAINNMVTTINAQQYPVPKIVFGANAALADWTNAWGIPVPMYFTKPVWFEGIGGGHTSDVGDYTKIGGTRIAWWGTSSDGGTAFGGMINVAPASTGGAPGTPTKVQSQTAVGTGFATTLNGTLPVAPANGNMLLSTVIVNALNATITAPAGWTLLSGPHSPNSGTLTSAVYYKPAASEGTSWTWTFNSSVLATVATSEYSGVATTAPTVGTVAATGGTSTVNTPVVTTPANNSIVIQTVASMVNNTGAFSVPGGVTLDSQGYTNQALQNNVGAVHSHDTANQAVAGSSTARTITGVTWTQAQAYTVSMAPSAGGGVTTAIKRPKFTDCWLDCRNGDQNQALIGLNMKSVQGAMIDDGFFVMDALAVGLSLDISTAPTEAKDSTRFVFGAMCFRQLDNSLLSPPPLTPTTITASSATLLTNVTPIATVTLTSTTGFATGGGYAIANTTIGRRFLVKYAAVSGSNLTNVIVSAEDVIHQPTLFVNAMIIPCSPNAGGAMRFSGGSGANTSIGVIKQVQMSFGSGWGLPAIDLGNSDSISFEQVVGNGGSNVTEVNGNRQRRPGIQINGSNVLSTLASRNHVLRDVDPGGSPGGALGGISCMGVLNTGAMMAFPSGPTYVDLQQMGNGSPIPTAESGSYLAWSGNGMFREGGLAALGATAALAAGGVVTGLAVPIPPQGWQIGTVIEYNLLLSKSTAVGTTLGVGIRQNSAITTGTGTLIANAAFTGTAVADHGNLRIVLTVSGPLGATCAGLSEYQMNHNLVSTAGVGTGLWTGAVTAGTLVSATTNNAYGNVSGAMTTWNSAAPGAGPQFLFLDIATGSTLINILAGSTVRCIKAALP